MVMTLCGLKVKGQLKQWQHDFKYGNNWVTAIDTTSLKLKENRENAAIFLLKPYITIFTIKS